MWKNLFTLFIVSCGFLSSEPLAVSAQTDLAFSGKALPQLLQPSGTVSCFADQAAVTGFYRHLYPVPGEPEVALSSSPLKSQSAGGGYKISIKGDQATVIDEIMKQSHDFQVYQRRETGIMLVRFKGVGIEIITIDPLNGSFVLTDSGVQKVWNRTNVWVGRCY